MAKKMHNSISNFSEALSFIKVTKYPKLLEIAKELGSQNEKCLLALVQTNEGFDNLSKMLGISSDFKQYSKLFKESLQKKPNFSVRLHSDYQFYLYIKILFPNIEVSYPDSFGYFDKKE